MSHIIYALGNTEAAELLATKSKASFFEKNQACHDPKKITTITIVADQDSNHQLLGGRSAGSLAAKISAFLKEHTETLTDIYLLSAHAGQSIHGNTPYAQQLALAMSTHGFSNLKVHAFTAPEKSPVYEMNMSIAGGAVSAYYFPNQYSALKAMTDPLRVAIEKKSDPQLGLITLVSNQEDYRSAMNAPNHTFTKKGPMALQQEMVARAIHHLAGYAYAFVAEANRQEKKVISDHKKMSEYIRTHLDELRAKPARNYGEITTLLKQKYDKRKKRWIDRADGAEINNSQYMNFIITELLRELALPWPIVQDTHHQQLRDNGSESSTYVMRKNLLLQLQEPHEQAPSDILIPKDIEPLIPRQRKAKKDRSIPQVIHTINMYTSGSEQSLIRQPTQALLQSSDEEPVKEQTLSSLQSIDQGSNASIDKQLKHLLNSNSQDHIINQTEKTGRGSESHETLPNSRLPIVSKESEYGSFLSGVPVAKSTPPSSKRPSSVSIDNPLPNGWPELKTRLENELEVIDSLVKNFESWGESNAHLVVLGLQTTLKNLAAKYTEQPQPASQDSKLSLRVCATMLQNIAQMTKTLVTSPEYHEAEKNNALKSIDQQINALDKSSVFLASPKEKISALKTLRSKIEAITPYSSMSAQAQIKDIIDGWKKGTPQGKNTTHEEIMGKPRNLFSFSKANPKGASMQFLASLETGTSPKIK